MEKKVVKSKLHNEWDLTLSDARNKGYDTDAIYLSDCYNKVPIALADLPALIAALQEIEREVKSE